MPYTVQYYDVLLAAIFASVAVGLGVAGATGLRVVQTVPVASVAAVALIVHGLFVRGPVQSPADLTEEVERLN